VGPLPAAHATDGEAIRPGRIYLAQPNRHLVVRDGRVRLEVGPRENSARPSVDALFRSAARNYGPRLVGVVLSGALSDGALGLAAIKMRGGVTIVQDPDEALFAGMPQSALSASRVDYCLRSADIAPVLVRLTEGRFEPLDMDTPDRQPEQPSQHAADEPNGAYSRKRRNGASGLTCPECHGSLWELSDGDELKFECRVGHTFSLDALLAEQGEAVEAALWSAVNSLQERAATLRRLSTATRQSPSLFDERAEATEAHAKALLELLRRLIDAGQIG
jgi:two-component system chemotaxis response regulator CheB